MVDSCSRESGVLCSVAWSWLLFFHEESEWKNSESNIVWGVDEWHQTFWFEMGQEYSTIVQIIVKADRGEAIA